MALPYIPVSNVTCASGVDLLADYPEGVLAPYVRAAIERHVLACDRCGGLGVWSIAEEARGAQPDDRVRRGVCVDCGAMLAVEIAAEAP